MLLQKIVILYTQSKNVTHTHEGMQTDPKVWTDFYFFSHQAKKWMEIANHSFLTTVF